MWLGVFQSNTPREKCTALGKNAQRKAPPATRLIIAAWGGVIYDLALEGNKN